MARQSERPEFEAAAERASELRGFTVDALGAMERSRCRKPWRTLCEHAKAGADYASRRASREAFRRARWLVANGYWPADFPQLVRCVQENKPSRRRFRPQVVRPTWN